MLSLRDGLTFNFLLFLYSFSFFTVINDVTINNIAQGYLSTFLINFLGQIPEKE